MGSTSLSKVESLNHVHKHLSAGYLTVSNCCILNSFIENFGTHVITSVTIGGKDVIYVKQHLSSPLSIVEIKNYVQDIGNQRFSSTEGLTSSGLLKYKDKASSVVFLPCHFITFSPYFLFLLRQDRLVMDYYLAN